ncbi:MAG: phosphatidate cytidylyltransferase [Geminicoccaceae bacterium]|nr:phosphatidate cytidylyltransferase [Geminicoccaceae bacterium]
MRPDLPKRLFGGAVVALIAAVEIGFGGWVLAGVLPFLLYGLAHEWTRLTQSAPSWRDDVLVAAAPVLVVVLFALASSFDGWRGDGLLPGLIVLLVVMALSVALLGYRGLRQRMSCICGGIYLGLPFLSLLWLRDDQRGLEIVVWLVVVIIVTDSCAYFVGSSVGGPKLAPKISPGKTWSGLVGGLVSAMAVGTIACNLIGFTWYSAALLAGVLALIAQGGDLFESWLKRRAGVKDSGRIIPGHGGLLDRLDGYMLALPALALVLVTKGVA